MACFSRQLRDFRERFPVDSPAQVLPRHLTEYVRLLSPGVERKTAWSYLFRLLPFFRWATRRRILHWDPAAELEVPRFSRTERRVLTQSEVESLLLQPNLATPWGGRDAAILELFYGTGLRLEEASALDLADLDLEQRRLQVRDGKGGKARLVPIGEMLRSVLLGYLESVRPRLLQDVAQSALWLNYQGKRLGYATLGKTVRRYGQKAGIECTPHALRHAYATHLLEGGAPLRLVQVLLGHASVLSTQIYTHLLPQELLRVYRRTHPRAKRKAGHERPL